MGRPSEARRRLEAVILDLVTARLVPSQREAHAAPICAIIQQHRAQVSVAIADLIEGELAMLHIAATTGAA